MTDAVPHGRASRAGFGIPSPPGDLFRRAALRLRDASVHEAAALLLPIMLVGVTHVDGPGLWLVALAYLFLNALLARRGRTWTAARVLSAWRWWRPGSC